MKIRMHSNEKYYHEMNELIRFGHFLKNFWKTFFFYFHNRYFILLLSIFTRSEKIFKGNERINRILANSQNNSSKIFFSFGFSIQLHIFPGNRRVNRILPNFQIHFDKHKFFVFMLFYRRFCFCPSKFVKMKNSDESS